MTAHAVPWLPESALTDTRTFEPVARVLADWSSEWLSGTALIAPPRWERCGFGHGDGTGFAMARKGDGHALLMRSDGELELASALFDRELSERDLRTPANQLVARLVIDDAIDALSEGLDEVLPSPVSGDAGTEAFAVTITCLEPLPLFRLEVELPVLVAIARNWSGRARSVETIAPRDTAIDEQSLQLSALIGTSRLQLAELETLGIGDVLSLDVPVDNLLNACINLKPSAENALALLAGNNRLELQIERPPVQW